jgi:hypothetical protein
VEKCQEQNACDMTRRSNDDDDDNNNNNNKDLEVEVQSMWNAKSKVATAVNCGNWNVLRIIRKVLAQQTGRARLQGTAMLGTVHTLRRKLT